MNETSITASVGGNGSIAASQRPGVHAIEDHDSLVLPEALVQLTASDVDRAHRDGALLQQAVGEASRRCADVETALTRRVDGEGGERSGELGTAP